MDFSARTCAFRFRRHVAAAQTASATDAGEGRGHVRELPAVRRVAQPHPLRCPGGCGCAPGGPSPSLLHPTTSRVEPSARQRFPPSSRPLMAPTPCSQAAPTTGASSGISTRTRSTAARRAQRSCRHAASPPPHAGAHVAVRSNAPVQYTSLILQLANQPTRRPTRRSPAARAWAAHGQRMCPRTHV